MASILYIESGRTLVDMVEMADSGDHISFNNADVLMSAVSGSAPVVRPNGVRNGLKLTPGTADTISMAAGSVYLAGVETTIAAAANQAVARPTLAYCTYSITITAGGAFAAVPGVESAAGLSTTRGADGGPPLVAVDAIEIGWHAISSASSGVYTAAEIKQSPGTHMERFDGPGWEVKRARVVDRILGVAGVDFLSALPLIHTGAVPKKVFIKYHTPDFAELPDAGDYVPAETSHSTGSTTTFTRVKGSTTSTLGQGAFSVVTNDGVGDWWVGLKNENLWFKFKKDKLEDTYMLDQGIFGIGRTFVAGVDTKVACTISAETAAVEVTG